MFRSPMIYRNAEGAAAGGGQPAAAPGAPTTVSTNADGNGGASASVPSTMGQAAAESQAASSASAKVPVAGNDPGKAASPDFQTMLGDFAKEPMFADFKDVPSLAKAYADTKKLVGQKLGIPGEDATPEVRDAFFKALGVPENGEGYGFKPPENMPEALKGTYSDEHAKKWADLFKKHNVPAEAANALRNEFFSEVSEEIGKMKTDVSKSDEEFAKMANETFGDETKANAALQSARTIIEKHLPDKLKAELNAMPNSALMAVAVALNGELKGLTGEDNALAHDSGAGASGKTVAELRAEALAIQGTPEYSNPFAKGKPAHEEAQKKVRTIYQQINQLESKKTA